MGLAQCQYHFSKSTALNEELTSLGVFFFFSEKKGDSGFPKRLNGCYAKRKW
jgi:hypothetical protein